MTEIPQIECEALVALYNELDGPNWGYSTSWLVTNTPCSWFRVRCGEGDVTFLYLSENRLKGDVPALIEVNLTNLTELTLD